MPRNSIGDLLAFLAVARECSLTRAAAKLGVSHSSLSHTLRVLETRLGVRLLTRTTRSVALTPARERLMENVVPRLQSIEDEVAAVSELGDTPAGTIRITAIEYAIDSALLPSEAHHEKAKAERFVHAAQPGVCPPTHSRRNLTHRRGGAHLR